MFLITILRFHMWKKFPMAIDTAILLFVTCLEYVQYVNKRCSTVRYDWDLNAFESKWFNFVLFSHWTVIKPKISIFFQFSISIQLDFIITFKIEKLNNKCSDVTCNE